MIHVTWHKASLPSNTILLIRGTTKSRNISYCVSVLSDHTICPQREFDFGQFENSLNSNYTDNLLMNAK